ncbi:DUF4328 domain-containing protein [Agromyces sp. GXQ0307]|uniref:DUF4328 domain-containing protein n=1 Tax=Agromyces sp. GXQ0307 TaxID=3377835 RepID=UPI00383B81E9
MTTTPPPATTPSDGSQPAPNEIPAQPGQGEHVPAPRALGTLATATQALLIVCGALSAVTIATELFGIGAVSGYLAGDGAAIGAIEAYDQTTALVSILASGAFITTGVLWAIWQYRAAKQVVGRTRRSPGWHAGSWFVPIVSLWFPYQNISDLWRAVGLSRPSWQAVWWLLFLGSNFAIQISTRAYLAAETLEQFRVAMWMSLIGEVLLLAAVPLAWMVVRGITRGILDRARPVVGAGGDDVAAPPA